MNTHSPWYDPNTEKSRLLAALEQTRRFCCMSEEIMPCVKQPGSYALLQAIKEAIDDYAECEMGHREFFLDKPHSAGCKHT
jgi:hypothetical protein